MWRRALALCVASFAGGAARAEPPPGLARLADVAPAIRQEMRYAGADNFTGRPVPGYTIPACWLTPEAAQALARAQATAAREGFALIVWDCYRPPKATAAFLAWARDPGDQARKADYYPGLDKSELFARGYIGAHSTHGLGAAVDLGLTKDGRTLDFGSGYDLFDPRSATASRAVSRIAQANRGRLKRIMESAGFANYAREWWHYGLKGARGARAFEADIE
ncbi:MAG: M15 family metallopeptidase [Rhizobiales bacterium]|nr:M15 family metallopeptidase [Hyphomicrobiales bacterium]